MRGALPDGQTFQFQGSEYRLAVYAFRLPFSPYQASGEAFVVQRRYRHTAHETKSFCLPDWRHSRPQRSSSHLCALLAWYREYDPIQKILFPVTFHEWSKYLNNEVSILNFLGTLVAICNHQVNNFFRVVFVHLAAKAAKINFFRGHGLHPLHKSYLFNENKLLLIKRNH